MAPARCRVRSRARDQLTEMDSNGVLPATTWPRTAASETRIGAHGFATDDDTDHDP